MWIPLVALLLAAPPEFTARTSAGEELSGALVELTADQVVIEAADGRQSLATSQLVSLSPRTAPNPPDSPGTWVQLTDGSTLAGTSYAVKDGQAHIELPGGQSVSLSTAAIAHVRWREQSQEQSAQWAKILESGQAGDLVVVRKSGALDYVAGVLGDVDPETVAFTAEDEQIAVKRSRIDGLVYFHRAGLDLPDSFCRVQASGGSQIEVESARIEAGLLGLKSPAGLEIDLPLETIAGIGFKIDYLSDLEPASATWTPYLGTADLVPSLAELYRPRFNEGCQGDALLLAGQHYSKGLALHSRTELVYRLPDGKYSVLRALAGIDDRLRPAGNVRLLIQGDDRTLFEGTITGQDEPKPVEADLRQVKRLKIVVDFGADMDVADCLNLCEARILK